MEIFGISCGIGYPIIKAVELIRFSKWELLEINIKKVNERKDEILENYMLCNCLYMD